VIVRRIILVDSIANEIHQKVSVDAFIVMEWNKVEVIDTKKGCKRHYEKGANSPEPF